MDKFLNKSSIAIIGLPGSGKTVVGGYLAEAMNFSFLDMDMDIVQKQKMSVLQIFSDFGEGYFRMIEAEHIKASSNLDRHIISLGGGAVLNKNNIDNLRNNCIIVHLKRSPETIISMIDVTARPLLVHDKNRVFELYKQRKKLYEEYSDFTVENEDSITDAVNSIMDIYNECAEQMKCKLMESHVYTL